MISFRVPGNPTPQGSMRAFVVKGQARVTHANSDALKNYRARVALAAQQAGARVVSGPVAIGITFYLQRPKSHYGTGRNGGLLKASAPLYPTKAPDVDKLGRAALDSMTAVCFEDDAQVVDLNIHKRYAGDGVQPGTTIDVMEVERRRTESLAR